MGRALHLVDGELPLMAGVATRRADPAIRDALLSTDLDGIEPPIGDLAQLLSETQLSSPSRGQFARSLASE
ncbi:hypothetical protein AB0F52_04365 [Amycolatopsis sp. NPDC024027]|uniref:hypothetical protein n=1 Tax=Amycolatopsis sp. NPDC024027 TaxID=3154327 RepID=UPI0033C7A52D